MGGRVVSEKNGRIVDFDIKEALAMRKDIDEYMYEINCCINI